MHTFSSPRLLGWAAFIFMILLIPLIAMQFTDEVNWSISDFLMMGLALTSIAIAYEFFATKSKNTIYRLAIIIGLLGSFLLFWVNGAVGIIGSENQDANLLYTLVFPVIIIGSFFSRMRAKGMAITMLSAAATQFLMTMISLIIWPPDVISWSPGVLGVFLLSGFFSFLFFLSGMLFHRVHQSMK